MQRAITLEALEVLDAIAKKGSFAAAANALYRVPSAITYSVRKLEEDLGVKLFKKEGRRSVLTPAGQFLLEQGRSLLVAANNLAETTRQVGTGWESQLNIAIDSILAFEPYYALVNDFFEVKPDIEVNIHEEVLGGIWESVINDRVSLAIGAGEPPTRSQGCIYVEMGVVQWVFAVPPDHPLTQYKLPLKLEDIEIFRPVIVRDTSRQLAPWSARLFSNQPVFSVPNLHEKISAQELGLGVGFLPLHRISAQLKSRRLVILPTVEGSDILPIHLVWKANNKGRALNWFVEKIRPQCEP